MAALMRLPSVYVIENNRYGMGTSVERASASHDLSRNGAPWGIPGLKVDGMDVLAVHKAAEQAMAHCRSGAGPFLIEAQTYRYRGHSMSDPAKYRTRDEVDEMRASHDAIESAKRRLVELGVPEDQLRAEEGAIRRRIAEAVQFAKDSPEPDEAELWTDVLVEARA